MTKAGTETAYGQQLRILSRQGVNIPNPQEQWRTDMLQFLNSIPKGDAKLVLTDANGSIDDDDLGSFVAEAGLYDLITLAHGREAPPTYIR
eukprot:11231167-Ditylum_brightwellii.AAC.1